MAALFEIWQKCIQTFLLLHDLICMVGHLIFASHGVLGASLHGGYLFARAFVGSTRVSSLRVSESLQALFHFGIRMNTRHEMIFTESKSKSKSEIEVRYRRRLRERSGSTYDNVEQNNKECENVAQDYWRMCCA